MFLLLSIPLLIDYQSPRSKWNKNIMSAPSETKTSCTLQVKQKHHVRSKWNKNIMYAPSEKIRNPNNLRCHSEQENKGHKLQIKN
jgi:hypothetical protein